MVNVYITIPIEVEALQYGRDNTDELIKFTQCSNVSLMIKNGKFNCMITVGEVKLLIIEGDYVVKNPDGSIRVLSEDDFKKLYIKKE